MEILKTKKSIDDLKNEKLTNDAYNFANNYNDDELNFIINELKFWENERKRQNQEILKGDH